MNQFNLEKLTRNLQGKSFLFFRDESCNKFLPLYLYSECLLDVLRNKIGITVDCISTLPTSPVKQPTYVFVFAHNIYVVPSLWDSLMNRNLNLIIINSEPNNDLLDTYVPNLLTNNTNNVDVMVLDYHYDNVGNYRDLGVVKYSPFLWHDFLTQCYDSLLDTKIVWENKDIDILIFGKETFRRKPIIDRLRSKYNVVCIIDLSHKEAVNTVERSKIVLNMFAGVHGTGYDIDKRHFDCYRLAFLFSNKAFVITETPTVNINEENLSGWEDVLMHGHMDNLENIVDKYIKSDSTYINKIVEKQYSWFKRHPMENSIKNTFHQKFVLNQ